MSTDVLRGLVVSSSLVAILLSLGGVVGLVRWHRRHPEVQQRTTRYADVSRTLRRGGTVVDSDRPMGVLVTEQLTLNSLPLVGTLLLGGSQVVRAVDRLDRAAVGSFAAGTTAVLMLLRVLVTLRSGHPDELGAAAGAGLLLLAPVHEVLRRRALAHARRCGLAPHRSWT